MCRTDGRCSEWGFRPRFFRIDDDDVPRASCLPMRWSVRSDEVEPVRPFRLLRFVSFDDDSVVDMN